ncbi:MAG: hypothetical protein K9H64_05080 [Bacteroidales bacterium]|nr:hypothetical protein [Bacteroidales bacterium]MCF8455211.1 hypothetical protein [Bacteroidales bacterium]
MILTNFEIHGNGTNKMIILNQSNLRHLEDLLNTKLINSGTILHMINDIQEIQVNWGSLSSIVNSKYNGFWDIEILTEFGVTGTWFTFAGYPEAIIYISVDNQEVYIENECFESHPTTVLSVTDFISVLNQWKDI